jgi:hypothetical protein
MRFGIFDGFKSERTLLVWTDIGSDLAPLVDSLDELVRGSRTIIHLDTLGAEAVGGVKVSIEAADQEAVILRESREGSTVQLYCSRERCGELSVQLRSLATPPCQVGHHYLDLAVDQPLQIMVSAGEYPSGLEP